MTGIKPPIWNKTFTLDSLKRDILLFDRVGTIALEVSISHIQKRNSYYYDELLLLQDQKIIFEASTGWCDEKKIDLEKFSSEEFKAVANSFQLSANDEEFDLYYEGWARLIALCCTYQLQGSFDTLPIINQLKIGNSNVVDKSKVYKIVINEMPLPDDSTAWQDILEFKNNPENKGRFAGLRNWINKISRSSNSVSEAKDELEYLLYQYEQSMKLHHIKFNKGILQTTIVGTAEITENMAKFNLSNIAKKLFSAYNENVDLLQAELNSPGREVAYIVKAKEEFIK